MTTRLLFVLCKICPKHCPKISTLCPKGWRKRLYARPAAARGPLWLVGELPTTAVRIAAALDHLPRIDQATALRTAFPCAHSASGTKRRSGADRITPTFARRWDEAGSGDVRRKRRGFHVAKTREPNGRSVASIRHQAELRSEVQQTRTEVET